MTLRVGLVGCGNIAPQYGDTLALYPDDITFVACADLDMSRAGVFARKYGIQAVSVDTLLTNGQIDLIVNLTPPANHAQLSLEALHAENHVWSEKPLALNLDDARAVLKKAKEEGVRIGCAPDTVLGEAIQTAKRLLDDGAIGKPTSATAFFAGSGMEDWHPNPFFFYQPGGGPMLDVGPYYLTTLYTLLGPAKSVMAYAGQAFTQRIAEHESIAGQPIPVDTPTHHSGVIAFQNGALANVITSFDMWAHSLPYIEIYGTEGVLSLPDPNHFDGTIRLWQKSSKTWQDIEPEQKTIGRRGIGVVDMVRAIEAGKPHRANGEVALHVLEMMLAFEASSNAGQAVEIASQP